MTSIRYMLNTLERTNWLDSQTRAVIFEGTVYNANSNLFTTIQLLLEMPASGGIFLYQNGVNTYRLYNYTGGKGMVLMMMQGIFLLICIYNIYKEIRCVDSKQQGFFRSMLQCFVNAQKSCFFEESIFRWFVECFGIHQYLPCIGHTLDLFNKN